MRKKIRKEKDKVSPSSKKLKRIRQKMIKKLTNKALKAQDKAFNKKGAQLNKKITKLKKVLKKADKKAVLVKAEEKMQAERLAGSKKALKAKPKRRVIKMTAVASPKKSTKKADKKQNKIGKQKLKK